MHVTRRALFRTDIYTQCVVNVKKKRKVNLRLINISNMQPLFDSNRQTFESNIQLLYSNLHLTLEALRGGGQIDVIYLTIVAMETN